MELKCVKCGKEDNLGVIQAVYEGWRTYQEKCICHNCALETHCDNDILSTYLFTKMKYDIDD